MEIRPVTTFDLNLLVALDILLTEGGVSAAARRLHLSPSAMSRTLGRIRDTFGDPILVRAGRSLVPTPRALELKAAIRPLLDEAWAMTRSVDRFDPATLRRTFVLRANEGFVAEFGGRLSRRLSDNAPGVGLCFAVMAQKDALALREGRVDLDIGVLGDSGPEIRLQAILRDRFVGVTDPDHPLATGGPVSAERYAAERQISVSRRGLARGPIDLALASRGLVRDVTVVVPGFIGALAMVRGTSLVANVPERQTREARRGLFSFPLPVETPEVTVAMMWHPRSDADQAHRWLRAAVRQAVED